MFLQKIKLRACFHTFRHDPHMQIVTHSYDRVDNAGIVRIRSKVAHE